MNTYDLCEELNNNPPEILLVGSSCMAVRIFGKHYKHGFMQTNNAQGSMGASIPVAIGIALASGKPVTVIDGEGSFCQNIQELEVVRRLNLPITFIVINNGGYASIHNSERRWFGRISEGASFPDIERIGQAFGVNIRIIHVPHDEVPPPREA